MMGLIAALIRHNVETVVYTTELEETALIQEAQKNGLHCYSSIDPRSAVYMATGIAAQNQKPVVCIVNSTNSSRSGFSGMTEAYYRNLPVIFVTVGDELDYSVELADVVQNHHIVTEDDDLDFISEEDMPIHLEIKANCHGAKKAQCSKFQQVLSGILDENAYLLIGSNVEYADLDYKCKIVKSGMPNCYEGAVANVLGASLAGKRKRYVGLVSETEFIHDINTLGNINVNDSLCFIVLTGKMNQSIDEYASSLGFDTFVLTENEIDAKMLDSAIHSNKKTVIQLVGVK